MYVRWKTRRRMVGYRRGEITLTAVLLECHRIDGQPRQKYVARLGTFCVLDELFRSQDPEDYVRVDGGFVYIGSIIWFWHSLTDHLDGLEADQRQAIESQIASRIPQPTDAQQLEYDEMLEQMGVRTS